MWCRHDMLAMVSGGSGITPFMSIIRELLYKANNGGGKTTSSILLICSFKKSEDLTMLDLVLPISSTNYNISCLQLQIEAYVTREKEPTTDQQKLPKNIWFKPDPSAVPISALLGQNGWLWLGIIVSASFVNFLLLLAILTRYYIYPIDHNSNMIYSFPSKCTLNMLFICVSIVTTATAVFLWNKKQNAKEIMQIQNAKTPTQVASNVAERELESLPHQSLVQATRVHHGKRPNLKSKLLSYTQNWCVFKIRFTTFSYLPRDHLGIFQNPECICLQEYCQSAKAQAWGFLLADQGRWGKKWLQFVHLA